MKAVVNADTCTGCGLCVDICPEVFEMDRHIATSKVDPIPDDTQTSCREAADTCPVEAISIEE